MAAVPSAVDPPTVRAGPPTFGIGAVFGAEPRVLTGRFEGPELSSLLQSPPIVCAPFFFKDI